MRLKIRNWIMLCFMLILLINQNSIAVSATETTNDARTAYVFIGDSRTVGMDNVVHMSDMDDTFVIAKVGMGAKWWQETGSLELHKLRTENTQYNKWVYIFNLGVNDLGNVETYKGIIDNLEKEATVYFISINPTVDEVKGVQCASIEKFNEIIEPVCDNYIDSYSYLKYKGYYAKDGMHYDKATYQTLYKFIDESIALNEFLNEQHNANQVLGFMVKS